MTRKELDAHIIETLNAIMGDCQQHLDTPRHQESPLDIDDFVAWVRDKSEEIISQLLEQE